jgi:hypothetical protein
MSLNSKLNNPAPAIKKQYDIKLEAMLPATLTYRVWADSPEEALLLTKKAQPINVKHNLAAKKNIRATVSDAYSSIIKLVKNLVGVSL